MSSQQERDALVRQFCDMTGESNREAAAELLASSDWELSTAVPLYYEQQEQGMDEDDAPEAPAVPAQPAPPTYTGPRTLDGRPAPESVSNAASSSSSRPVHNKPPSRGPRTLKDLQAGSSAGHGHGHGHDDDSDEEGQDFFTGGEKSGLAVQDPNANNQAGGRNPHARDVVNSILDQARRHAPRPDGDDPAPQSTAFRGGGHTLGGEGTESTYIAGPTRTPSPPPRVTRVLHIWDDGFSIDDGELHSFEDPRNTETLRMIQSGRAPLALLNVQAGQEVDLEVHPHAGEKYTKPKQKYKPFGGSGQRLGSPTPGVGSSAFTAPPAQAAAASTHTSAPDAPSIAVNESEPTLTLQIRLGDGTRLTSRFNTSHTIGDVYGFVDRARNASRRYVLQTTFPSKELTDKSAVLGELPEFKRGGVVVQKWT